MRTCTFILSHTIYFKLNYSYNKVYNRYVNLIINGIVHLEQHYMQVTECSGCALSVALRGQHLHTAHGTDPLLVGARLAVVRTHLVNFLLKRMIVM